MSVTRNLHFRGKYVKGEREGESESGRSRIEVVLDDSRDGERDRKNRKFLLVCFFLT